MTKSRKMPTMPRMIDRSIRVNPSLEVLRPGSNLQLSTMRVQPQDSSRMEVQHEPRPSSAERELLVTKTRQNGLMSVLKPIWPVLLAIVFAGELVAQPAYDAINDPPHNYGERRPKDKFTRLQDDI